MRKIQILGSGCAKCHALADNAQQAAATLGEEVEIVKVTELNEIMTFGCMMTPGLAVEGQLVAQGKVLKPEQIMALLKAAGAE